ncbi:MAG: hypothetical protein IKE95_06600 [Methanobrevibacter sp.]|nr:hypothetical protein [Methanobrevibacter sp.]
MGKNSKLDETKIKIINSLNNGKYYNKRHTPMDNVCKRLTQIPCKKIKKAIKELRKEEIIKIKPTYHGADVSLNVKKKKEIDEYLKKNLIKK